MHFFNPVPVLPLVELVTTLKTGPTVARARRGVRQRRARQAGRPSADRSGFVVNALLVPYLLSAIRMVESGFATKEDIDKAMVLGCAHPMGPLALTDLVGLDTVKSIADSMYEEFKEPLYSPPPLLHADGRGRARRKEVRRGLLRVRRQGPRDQEGQLASQHQTYFGARAPTQSSRTGCRRTGAKCMRERSTPHGQRLPTDTGPASSAIRVSGPTVNSSVLSRPTGTAPSTGRTRRRRPRHPGRHLARARRDRPDPGPRKHVLLLRPRARQRAVVRRGPRAVPPAAG